MTSYQKFKISQIPPIGALLDTAFTQLLLYCICRSPCKKGGVYKLREYSPLKSSKVWVSHEVTIKEHIRTLR